MLKSREIKILTAGFGESANKLQNAHDTAHTHERTHRKPCKPSSRTQDIMCKVILFSSH